MVYIRIGKMTDEGTKWERDGSIVVNGRIELAQPASNWPDGTQVEVTPIIKPTTRVDWLSLPPLNVGDFSGN